LCTCVERERGGGGKRIEREDVCGVHACVRE